MEGELRKETREEYFLRLDKSIEKFEQGKAVVFEKTDHLSSVDVAKLVIAQNPVEFFKTIQIDVSGFKFDRDEANER